jgi:hypothetical protein
MKRTRSLSNPQLSSAIHALVSMAWMFRPSDDSAAVRRTTELPFPFPTTQARCKLSACTRWPCTRSLCSGQRECQCPSSSMSSCRKGGAWRPGAHVCSSFLNLYGPWTVS